MFDVKKLIEELKAKGLQDEEIKKTLADIKTEIDAFLGNGGADNQDVPPATNPEEENPEDKQKRIFGI